MAASASAHANLERLDEDPSKFFTVKEGLCPLVRPRAQTHKKIVPLNMKVDEETLRLIDYAAQLLGQQRTQFVLDAATAHAEEVILNRRLFVLSATDFDAFDQALNQPRSSDVDERLQKLLGRPKRWG